MSINQSRADRTRKIDELLGLEREIAVEMWSKIEIGLSDNEGAIELGVSLKYFRNRVAYEFATKLSEGRTAAEFPKFNAELEEVCWQTVCELIKSDETAKIDTPLCKQLRLNLLDEYKSQLFIESLEDKSIRKASRRKLSREKIAVISQRFDLDKDRVKALIALAMAETGQSLEQIGEQLIVSRERARQIISSLGVSVRSIREIAATTKSTHQSELSNSIESWINEHSGCYLFEILEHFSITEACIQEIRLANFQRLVMDGRKAKNSASYVQFSRQQVLEALTKAYELRNPSMSMYSVGETRPLTGPYYETLRKSGNIHGPSQPRILQVFGTWKAACEEAGVPSLDSIRGSYELRWTDQQLVEQLAEFISTTEFFGVQKFDEWCRMDDSRSSSGTLRNQFGTWSDAYQLALLHLRKRWSAN